MLLYGATKHRPRPLPPDRPIMMMPPSPSSTHPDRQTSGKVRLHNAIILPLILQMLGAIGLVGWIALRSNDTIVQNLAQKLRNEIIEHVHDRISTYIAAPHLVNETNRIALDLGMLTWDNPSQAETYFRRQALSQPSIGYVGFANENAQYLRVGWVNRLADQPQLETAVQLTPGGGTLAYYGLNPNSGRREAIPSQTIPNYDVRLRPFYTIAQQEDRPAWRQIYTNVAYPLLQINASTPYYDRDGEFQGILTTQLGLNQIGAFLEFFQSFKSGTLYILERDGNLVATSLKTVPLLTRANPNDPTLPFDRIPARNSASPLIQSSVTFLETQFGQLAAIQSSHQLDFIFNEERHFLQVSPFQDPYGIDWLIVAVFPESDFIAEVRGNQQTMVLLGIGIFLILGSTSFLTTRLLTQPLRTLVTTTETAATAIATESTTESTTDNIATITQELTSPSHTAAITNNSRDTAPSDQNTRPNPHQNPDHPPLTNPAIIPPIPLSHLPALSTRSIGSTTTLNVSSNNNVPSNNRAQPNLHPPPSHQRFPHHPIRSASL
ncbi:MAG: PDC sensor domain-containing protein [Prochlorothrix sp.]